jgi:iron complex outermembrane recepter protein
LTNTSMKAALFCSATLAAVTAAFDSSAQTTPTQLQEVVVTAQRRAELLEDVPMSVSVVSQEVLTNSGVNSVRDLANVTTGFQVGNGGSYPQPAIRGITTINAGSYENNVAVFVDGLYQTTPQVLNIDLPNVRTIQVLKGPQGTLYGRNATGGAILIDTIDPGSSTEGNIEASYGRFNDRRARGYVAGPISDSVGFSLAGTYRKTDGYIKRANQFVPGEFAGRFLGLDQQSLRGKLKFEVTDEFRVTLGSSYVRASDARGVLFTPIENVSSNYAAGSGRDTRPRELGEAAGDVFELDLKQYEQLLKLELDTGIGTLRSISGFTVGKLRTFFDFGGSYVPDSYSASIIRDQTLQESLDFTIDAIDNVDLIVGGTYYNIKTKYDGLPNTAYLGPASYAPFTYPNPALQAVPLSDYRKASETDFFRTKEAWALFADATFHATDRLSISLGGRYSHETQDVSGLKNNFVTATGPALGSLLSTPYTRASSAKTSDYSKFTPRASIVYEVLANTNIYASYSKGFRGGEWNSVIPSDNPALWFDVKQEDVTAYEVGVKSLGRRLRFELAGFYYDYKNLQVSFTQNVNNVAVVTLQNAPSAEIYGSEASVDYAVNENFSVRAGATWLHARYGDRFIFTGAGVNPALPGFNSNGDPLKTFQNITISQDLSGLPMARSPNFTAFIGADYLIPDREGGWRFSGNVKYTSSYVVTNPSVWGGDRTFNTRVLTDPNAIPNNAEVLAGTPYVGQASKQRARQGDFVLINASVTWTDPEGRTYVRLWGNNLTNEKYRTHYNPISTGTYAPIAEPMTYGATAGYKF